MLITSVRAQYALPLFTNKFYLRGGTGTMAMEAYHAGAVRVQLLQNSTGVVEPWGVDALTITQARPGHGAFRLSAPRFRRSSTDPVAG